MNLITTNLQYFGNNERVVWVANLKDQDDVFCHEAKRRYFRVSRGSIGIKLFQGDGNVCFLLNSMIVCDRAYNWDEIS